MNQEIDRRPEDPREWLVALLVRSVTSRHSKATYRTAVHKFFDWLENRPLDRAAVYGFREHMELAGLAPSTISLRLSAIRQLCREARIAGWIDHDTAESITSIRGPGNTARRLGNWIGAADAARLIQTPPADTLRGRRDRAMLAVLIGCGIRRAELARLADADIQQREGRWCVVDLAGKGRKLRTVPMPGWTKVLVDRWIAARDQARKIDQSNIIDQAAPRLFCSMDNRGNLHDTMSSNAIYETVLYWAKRASLPVAPHDLRRTFSRLALNGRADLHQIQLSLGHASIQTTERYLGSRQDLGNAPCDVLGIVLGGENEPPDIEG